jgi:methylmalonyl-CoA mutase cobalamin-binding subunit
MPSDVDTLLNDILIDMGHQPTLTERADGLREAFRVGQSSERARCLDLAADLVDDLRAKGLDTAAMAVEGLIHAIVNDPR